MHWNYFTMVSHQADRDVTCIASVLYHRARRRAFLRRLWSALNGRSQPRTPFAVLGCTVLSGTLVCRTVQCLPLTVIRASARRDTDFDARFDPLTESRRARWLRIVQAELRGDALPPIEVVQVGECFVVRDGQVRMSVARALGRRVIEARVLTWHTNTAPPRIVPSSTHAAPARQEESDACHVT